MKELDDCIIPPHHIGFKAKPILLKEEGKGIDCFLAYIEPEGGGPQTDHTHAHDHLFIVIEGVATIYIEGEINEIGEGQSLIVDGSAKHSVWNKSKSQLKMIGINLYNDRKA